MSNTSNTNTANTMNTNHAMHSGGHDHGSGRSNRDEAEHVHPDDPGLQNDHTELLDLMDARAAGRGEGVAGVATAVQSGDFSDPVTWGGTLPSADMTIVIPKDVTVTVDQSPGVDLMSVIVRGGLEFATDQDIDFVVDEILTDVGSVFHIGEPGNPVTGTVDIVIREDTPSTTDAGRVEIDPTQLGKGIVTHGEVRIEGIEKADHIKVSADPMAGDTSLTFSELPEGWASGDKIVITGTHLEGEVPKKHSLEQAYQYGDMIKKPLPSWIQENFLRDDPEWNPDTFDFFDKSTYPKGPGDWRFDVDEFITQDEIRVVEEVIDNGDGTYTVTFNEPLVYNHDAPKDVGAEAGREPVDMFASVANYSRSISVTSEVAHAEEHPGGEAFADEIWVDDNAGFEADEIHDRGHIMFMHNPDVQVRNAEFAGLGRTDKSRPLDSLDWDWTIAPTRPTFKENYYTRWKFEPNRDENGDVLSRDPLEITNQPGRYGVHFHRTGTDTSEDPAILEGSSVWGSPGWGVVHHDSHLDVLSNAVFGIRGGGIVSETGNETGSWNGNIVVKTTGSSDNLFDSGGTPRESLLDDTFHGGDAYGFESRLIESSDNIAVSAQAFGFKFIGPNNNNGDVPADAFKNAQGYDPFWGDEDIVITKVPNRTFVDNESYASRVSFGSTLHKDFPSTQAVTLIDGFQSWHSDTGVSLAYARGYLFKDNVYVGDVTRPAAHGYRDHNGEPIGQKGIDPSTDTDLNRGVNNHFENLESDFTAPPADIWVGNTKTNVVKPFVSEEEQALIDANGGTYLKSNPYTFGTIFHDKIEDLPRDIQHLKFVQDGKLDLSLARGDKSITMEGYVEDALLDGSYIGQYRSVYDDPIAALITNSSQGTLYNVNANWTNMLMRDGFYTDEAGTKYLLVDLVISSKITGTVGVHKVAVDLADNFPIPPQAKYMGDLPLGLSAENRFSDLVVVDLRELGESGNQLSEAQFEAATSLLYPEPQEGAGQYAYEFAENYIDVSFHNKFNNGRDNVRAQDMDRYDTDASRKAISIGQSQDIVVRMDGDDPVTIRELIGQKLQSGSKMLTLFTAAMEHGGEMDLGIVDGGRPGDDFFTLVMATPELDFLRVEGSGAVNAINAFYEANPDVTEPDYSLPGQGMDDDDGGHGHGGGDDGHGGGDDGHGGGDDGHGGGDDGHGGGGDDGHGGGDTDLTDDEIRALVQEGLASKYGLGTNAQVTFVALSDAGLTLNLHGQGEVTLSGHVAQEAIASYQPDNSKNLDTKDGRSAIALFDLESETRQFLGGGTGRVTVDGDNDVTLKDLVGQGLRATGKNSYEKFLDVALETADKDNNDIDILAGGLYGDDYITLALHTGRATDTLIIEGAALEEYLKAYHGAPPEMPDMGDVISGHHTHDAAMTAFLEETAEAANPDPIETYGDTDLAIMPIEAEEEMYHPMPVADMV